MRIDFATKYLLQKNGLAEDVDANLNLPNLFTSNPREKELLETVIDKKMRSLSIGKKFSFF